jgi:carbon storage regulator
MLVLTRNIEETIVIDGRIRVKILSSGKGKVRLGISAPHSVRVDREEIHNRVAAEVCLLRNGENGLSA